MGFSAISNGDAFAAGYEIADKGGNVITLNTTYDSGLVNNEDAPKWTISNKMTSMATVPDIWSEGKIVRGDFTYYYKPGANNTSMVRYIVWQQNGNRYAIGGAALDIYNDPVIQGLLSLDEQEFRAARNKLLWNMTFTKTETVLICVIPFVLAAGVLAVILIRKKKKVALAEAPAEDPAQ